MPATRSEGKDRVGRESRVDRIRTGGLFSLRRETVWLSVVLAFAALLRALAWWRSAALFDDGPLYIAIAEAMAEGDWSNALLHPYHPLYPLATRLLAPLSGGFESAAAAVSIAAGTAGVAALYAFVRDAFDRRTALAAAILLSLHPEALAVSSDVQSDGLYAALFLGAVAVLWRALRTAHPGLAAAAGGLAGLAYLTRPEGLGVVGIGAGAVLVLVLRRKWRPTRGLAIGLALGLGAAAVAAPYVVALRVQTGGWHLTQKKSVLELATLSESNQSPIQGRIGRAPTLPRASDGPRARPAGAWGRARLAARELYVAAVPAFGYEFWLLLALGLWACRTRRDAPPAVPGRGAFVGGIALFYGLVLCALAWSAGYASRRHALPPLLPLLGFAGVGAAALGRAVLLGLARLRLFPMPPPLLARGAAAAVVGLALIASLELPRDLSVRRASRLAVRRAAEWLHAQQGAPGAVAAGRPRVPYYARGTFVPLPSSPQGGMIHYLREHQVRYVIVDEAKLDEHRGLREAAGAGLRLLHRERAEGRNALVYEVAPPAPPGAASEEDADAAKR